MRCHIGVDRESGLLHTARRTNGTGNDAIEAISLARHDREVCADVRRKRWVYPTISALFGNLTFYTSAFPD